MYTYIPSGFPKSRRIIFLPKLAESIKLTKKNMKFVDDFPMVV